MEVRYKYWTFNQGQLCNQLYYALQMFIKGEDNKCIVQDDMHDVNGIFNSMVNLGVEGLITTQNQQNTHIESYCQHINSDFKLSDIHSFVEKYILNSITFKKHLNNTRDKGVSIHIRCSDYLDTKKNNFHNCFNREKYLRDALRRIYTNITDATVFSDDITLVKTQYGDILSERFHNVEYIIGGNAEDDLIKMALFKNKILWNSTYSFWGAFIGDVIYRNDNHNVFVPSKFSSIESSSSRINPKWSVIEV